MDLIKDIEKGKILPVYLFCGSERQLMEEALKKVESLVVDPSTRCFNYNLFQGTEVSAENIISVAQTVPMMARKRLVVVKDVDKLAASELDRLSRYIKDPSPTTCLVLAADKVDMRKGLFQALKPAAVYFEPLYENQVPSWIKKEAEGKGKSITPDAVHYLAEAVGNDLMKLRNELEKAALYVGDRKEIAAGDIENVTTRSKLESIFKLTDAVGSRDAAKALKVLADLLESGENGVKILYMVTRHLRLIYKVKELMEAGLKGDSVSKEAGVHPFVLKGVISQVKGFSKAGLREAFKMLLEADTSLKSGKLSERLVLEGLFLDLARV